jgi:3-oxoacyl-[acyl-carrier-protein] synthase II
MPFGAELQDFEPKQYVQPRKSLKVMSRDIQTAYAAADLAMQDGKLEKGALPPERLGVVFGSDMIYSPASELESVFRECIQDGEYQHDRWGEAAMRNIYPLWMLKYLPNFPACHVGIVYDARGPNNSITMGDASSLLAFSEAISCIQRGMADVMLTGGTGTRLSLVSLMMYGKQQISQRKDDPAHASRPFDADRDGMCYGEGSAAFLIESREHAEARGAKIKARILGCGQSYEDHRFDKPGTGDGYRRAIEKALAAANINACDIGHVNAHGESTTHGDRCEAAAIHDLLGDVPVTALKSYFGNLGAGSGAVELIGSLLALETGEIPVTLNYETPDPACPVNVVHDTPLATDRRIALALNQSRSGQTAAMIIAVE